MGIILMNFSARTKLFLLAATVGAAVVWLALSVSGASAAPTRSTSNSLLYGCNPALRGATIPATWPVSECGWLFFEHSQSYDVEFTNVTVTYEAYGGNQYNHIVVSIFDGAWNTIGDYPITQPGYGVAVTSVDLSGVAVADRTGTAINIVPMFGSYYGFTSGQFDNIDVSYNGAEATPLPFATSACITGTTPIAQPTRTPFGFTPTPTRTATPGGPTPTRTSTPSGTQATPTPQAVVYDSGTIRFNSNLSPLTFIQYTGPITGYKTEWQNANGIDNLPGVAYVKEPWSFMISIDEVFTGTLSGDLVLSSNLMSFPLSVSGYMRVQGEPLAQGDEAYVTLLYFDPDYFGVGQGGWVPVKEFSADTQWNRFSAVLNARGGSGKISALAFGEYVFAGELYQGIWFDDIRVTSGRNASHLPVCGVGGGGGSFGGGPTKTCKVKVVPIDVLGAKCPLPTDNLDIGAWLSYLWCRVKTYFDFVAENRAQLMALRVRQNGNEPLGTMLDMYDSVGILWETVSDIMNAQNANFVQNRVVDFSLLWNWQGIDTPPTLVEADPSVSFTTCEFQIANVSPLAQQTACFIITTVKSNFTVMAVFQWMIDFASITIFLSYVDKRFLHKTT